MVEKWAQERTGDLEIVNGDAVEFLSNYQFEGNELVYCDPPYLQETRRKPRIYRYEYSRRQHEVLLATLDRLPCHVMVSGYRSRMYDERLQNWISVDFPGDSHTGPRTETVWLNFDPPDVLHDYRFIGRTFRDRESIKRRRDAISKRIEALPPIERNAILSHLATTYSHHCSPNRRLADMSDRDERALQ